MGTWQKILVAIKQPGARRQPVLERAALLARAAHAELRLFHDLSMPIAVGRTVQIEIGSQRAERFPCSAVVRHRRGVHHGLEFQDVGADARQQIQGICAVAMPVADTVHAEELVEISKPRPPEE